METCYVLYLEGDIIQREPTQGSLSTISPNMDGEEPLADGILPPAGWDRPKPSWFDFGQCT